ncbi:MAG: hypothetical protein C4554_07145 [Dethiobacter sp.]|jgi:uncharacterized protein YhaN|nr:MAG: hypothetical protein C4554_07145 [Dethiobacter sp.]
MILKEFCLKRYGPVARDERFVLKEFNLFFGHNEDGKSLSIDALLKMLLGRSATPKIFAGLDRVEENPEGYVVLQGEDGKEMKLPGKGDPGQMADINPSEYRNIFIIRNSDLAIDRESDFYAGLTDRLTGLRIEEISSLKKKLMELGKLTRASSEGLLSDDARYGKIKSRFLEAADLVKKTEILMEESTGAKLDLLEDAVIKIAEELEGIGLELENLEMARKRKIYEGARTALENLEEAGETVNTLSIFNSADEELWRDNLRDRDREIRRCREMEENINSKKEELKKARLFMEEKERDLHLLRRRKEKVDNDIKPLLRDYDLTNEKLGAEGEKSRFFAAAGIISAVLLLVTIAGIIARPAFAFYVLSMLFLTSAAVFALMYFSYVRGKARLKGLLEKIKFSSARYQLGGASLGEVLENMAAFEDNLYRKEEELKKADSRLSFLQAEIQNRESEKEKCGQSAAKSEDIIEKIKIKSGLLTLDEYSQKLREKQEQERIKEKQAAVLKNLFGAGQGKIEEDMFYWRGELEKLKVYEHAGRGLDYDEERSTFLKNRKKELEEEKNSITAKMAAFTQKLREIEQKANGVFSLEGEHFHCNTLVDLQAIQNRLKQFINEVETSTDYVLKAISIFEEIEREEEEKVLELFGRDSLISAYFAEITGNLYEEVNFNPGVKTVEVKNKDGHILSAVKLSGGAFDQLYLSVRLALGEKLLKGQKGFFILDDPFVKADLPRLRRQLEVLQKICAKGWQVLYFTAKEEVGQVLHEDIAAGKVNYIQFH